MCLLKALEAELSRRFQNQSWSFNDYLPNPTQTCRLWIFTTSTHPILLTARPSSLPSRPCHSFVFLSGNLIWNTHTHTNIRMSVHTLFVFTPSRQRVSATKWQQVIPRSQTHYTLLPSSSPHFISAFSFSFSPSVTHPLCDKSECQ